MHDGVVDGGGSNRYTNSSVVPRGGGTSSADEDDIKKFLKKERKNSLPSGAKYWGFDCKFGESEETSVEVNLSSLTKSIDAFVEKGIMTFYVEITPKAINPNENPPAQED